MNGMNTVDTPPPTLLEQLSLLLWPQGEPSTVDQVYWLLDGARDPAIVELLERSPLASRCLYSGPLTPRLRAAAPWLVHLTELSPASLALLQAGWGNAWGILIVAPKALSLDQLRLHCKKFLRVRTADQRLVMFRFYDPRVLAVFLPTCSERQYRALLGPTRRLIVELEQGRQWQVFEAGTL